MSTPSHEYPPPVPKPDQYAPNAPQYQNQDTLRPPYNGSDDSDSTAREGYFANATGYRNDKDRDTFSQTNQTFRTQSKREEHRLEEDLELLKAERESVRDGQHGSGLYRGATGASLELQRTKTEELLSPPGGQHWNPPAQPTNKLASLVKHVHQSSILVRYFTYIVPVAIILLIPLLLARYLFRDRTVGGVRLMWFCIWLMIVWLSLWAGRLISDCIPPVVGVIAAIFTNNAKKWKNVVIRLKLPLTLFFWWMAVFISFQPTMRNHHRSGDTKLLYWEERTHIVFLAIFVGTALNLVEKMCIQLISMSFHTRTYEDRIDTNKFQISCLTKLYAYSRTHLQHYQTDRPISTGARTPKEAILQAVSGGARTVMRNLGDTVGKIAGDFTGREAVNSASPKVVVRTLLQEREGTLALARRLYRTFADKEADVLHPDDLRKVFPDEEECEAAFMMFDRDLNGDISCEEMELACNEVSTERKAITAGLQDLDVVIGQLDKLFTFVVVILTVLLFVSLISSSSMNVLTSASALVLAFSFAFASTAQEIVNAILFVFIKHPYDVGDRVDIYPTGNFTIGATYYVKNLSLLYTEFKKPTGEIVQMPNALLNTVVILNMRRTGSGLAEAVPVYLKFGTSLEQIDQLREKMLEFVRSEKREYMGKIITELKDICSPTWELKLNVVFFYKSNWQNELVRLSRRNKFFCSLMTALEELGIESSHMRWAGQKPNQPLYLSGNGGNFPGALPQGGEPMQPIHPLDPHSVDGANLEREPFGHSTGLQRHDSIRSGSFSRARSTRAMDLSLGTQDMIAYDDSSDVYADRKRPRRPSHLLARVREEELSQRKLERSGSRASRGSSAQPPLHREGTQDSKQSKQSGNIASSMRHKLFGVRSHKDKEEDESMEMNFKPGPSTMV